MFLKGSITETVVHIQLSNAVFIVIKLQTSVHIQIGATIVVARYIVR